MNQIIKPKGLHMKKLLLVYALSILTTSAYGAAYSGEQLDLLTVANAGPDTIDVSYRYGNQDIPAIDTLERFEETNVALHLLSKTLSQITLADASASKPAPSSKAIAKSIAYQFEPAQPHDMHTVKLVNAKNNAVVASFIYALGAGYEQEIEPQSSADIDLHFKGALLKRINIRSQ